MNKRLNLRYRSLYLTIIAHSFYSKTQDEAKILMCVQLLSRVQLFVTPLDRSPPGSFVQEIFRARILEWVAISSSRGSSQPSDQPCISCTGRRILYHWVTWEAHFTKRDSRKGLKGFFTFLFKPSTFISYFSFKVMVVGLI